MSRRRRDIQSHDPDPLIPILNLVCMLIPLLLYGAVFVKFQTIQVTPPKLQPLPLAPQPDEPLNLTVIVTQNGFHIRVNPRYRKPWMDEGRLESFPQVPNLNGNWDFEELRRRLASLKNDHPGVFDMKLGAENDIAFDAIIKTMDFTRGDLSNPLFPNITLIHDVV